MPPQAGARARGAHNSNNSSTNANITPKLRRCTPFKENRPIANYDDDGTPVDRRTRHLDFCEEMEGTWIEPLETEDWLRYCVDDLMEAPVNPFVALSRAEDTTEEEFVTSINESGICENLFAKDTHAKFANDPTTTRPSRPDIALLTEDISFDSRDSDERQERVAGLCEMFMDFKFGRAGARGEDPFAYLCGEPNSAETDSEVYQLGRGQLTAYANMMSNEGHRLHCFAAVIMRDTARLLRFDRSGVIYTKLFDWRNTPILADFIYTLDKMSPEQRGWDPSVERLAKDSPEVAEAWAIVCEQASKVLPRGINAGHVISDSLNEMRSLCLIHVFDDTTSAVHRLVVDKPRSYSNSYIGRGTRGFLAVDLDEKTIVYLKDTWRLAFDSMLKESDTYRKLGRHKVPHLSDFMMGGDVPVDWRAASKRKSMYRVPFQDALTWTLLDEDRQRRAQSNRLPHSDANIEVEPHTHHRLIMRKIGIPVRKYRCSKEFVGALRDVLTAHDHAATAAKILHRDLSHKNVMLDKDERGMLIDWDMAATYFNRRSSVQRRKSRTGTFRFMSTNILQKKKDYVHSARDDMESLLHILFYTILTTKPLPPEDSDDRYMWEQAIHNVWNPSGNMVENRMSFIRGTLQFTREALEDHLQPLALAELMVELRSIFTPIYHDARLVARNKIVKEEQEASEARLRDGTHLSSVFERFLTSTEFGEWPTDDAAVDTAPVYPPTNPIRPPMAATATGSKRKRGEDAGGSTFASGTGNLVIATVTKSYSTADVTDTRRRNAGHQTASKNTSARRRTSRSLHSTKHTASKVSSRREATRSRPLGRQTASQSVQSHPAATNRGAVQQTSIGDAAADQSSGGLSSVQLAKSQNAGKKAKSRVGGKKGKGRSAGTKAKVETAGKPQKTQKASPKAKAGDASKPPPKSRQPVKRAKEVGVGKLKMNLRTRAAAPSSDAARG